MKKLSKEQKELLIEGCKVMAEENLRICKEWEKIDCEIYSKWD